MPSSGAVIHMICNGPTGRPPDPRDKAGQRRLQLIQAFLHSVWPFHGRSAPALHAEQALEEPDENGNAKHS